MLPITKFNQTFIKTKKTNDGYEYRAYNMKKFRDKIKKLLKAVKYRRQIGGILFQYRL